MTLQPVRSALAATGAVLCGAIASTSAAAPAAAPIPVVGVTQVAGVWTLRPLDPRTLAPVPGSWSHPVSRKAVPVRSPGGTGVLATARSGRPIVVDARTGRIAKRYEGDSMPIQYWLGGELPVRAGGGPLLLGEYAGACWSQGCGTEYEVVGSGFVEGYATETAAVLRTLLVVHDVDDRGLATLALPSGWSTELTYRVIRLPKLPRSAPMRVVADVAADRLYAISSSGVVARVDRVSGQPRVSYHRVPLNGRPFEAAWAGRGRIVLWGEDGLGTIDTRTWTARAVTPTASDVVVTPFGVASWVRGAGGIAVYRPDGTLRFQALTNGAVRSAESLGRYLYVRAGSRYAIDMREGRVVGRVRDDVRIARPSVVALP